MWRRTWTAQWQAMASQHKPASQPAVTTQSTRTEEMPKGIAEEEEGKGEDEFGMEVDFEIDYEKMQENVAGYFEAGFQQSEGEDSSATHARLQEWAKAKREEQRQQAKTLRKAFGANSQFQKKK